MSTKIQYLNASQFEDQVLHADVPVVVDFYSTECPPCEALASKYDALAELYGDDIRFVKIFRQENRELALELGVSSSPTVLFYQEGVRVGETLAGGIKRAELVRNLDALLSTERSAQVHASQRPSRTECDVLILGAGPAGLTAALYLAQARFKTIVVDRALAGGNVALTHQVSNFPGFVEPQPGYMLAHHMTEQAKAAGAEFRLAVEVTDVDVTGRSVTLDGLETIRARKVILATGSSPRPLNVPGEREYRGRGISYCATCDAKYYQDKHVVVVGGGNSAVEEALFIAKFASRITVIHQLSHFQANKQAQERLLSIDKVEVLFEHEPREFVRVGDTVGRVKVQNLETGELKDLACHGVFIFAGMQPNLELFEDEFALDGFGYIQTTQGQHTSRPDWFAIGDVASKRYRQITTAVSDGTVAAMAIAQELESEENAVLSAPRYQRE
ncbi:MAG TPA: FAD-dependent oxidoreductase [Stenomitos sp.]